MYSEDRQVPISGLSPIGLSTSKTAKRKLGHRILKIVYILSSKPSDIVQPTLPLVKHNSMVMNL